MPDFSFKRGERLKSKKVIEQLFGKGQSFGQYPLRLVWSTIDRPLSKFPVQYAVTVPKKKFPKATQRNRIKRQMREAYRLRKHVLHAALEEDQAQLAFMVIYTAKEALPSRDIEIAMQKMIKRFLKKWKEKKEITNSS